MTIQILEDGTRIYEPPPTDESKVLHEIANLAGLRHEGDSLALLDCIAVILAKHGYTREAD